MATMPSTDIVPIKRSLLEKFGERYEIDSSKVMSIVSATVFRQSKDEPPLSQEETAAALIVANQYELNPFTKEIYAFRSKGKLLIVVSVDGWAAIVNRQSQLDGIEFEEHFDDSGKIVAVTCKVFRKDRRLPIVVTEYTNECRRNTDPWNNMPIRMTRNRSFVQCARIAFSISGLVEEDEAGTIEGYNGPIIDASHLSVEEQECEILMEQAKWDNKKRDSARKSYKGRAGELLAYLRPAHSAGKVTAIHSHESAGKSPERAETSIVTGSVGAGESTDDSSQPEYREEEAPTTSLPPHTAKAQPKAQGNKGKFAW